MTGRWVAVLVFAAGCGDPSCLRGGDDCVIATPCERLKWSCEGGETSVRRVVTQADIPGGMAALGALGDFVLENDQVTVVIEDIDHPHNQAVTGGSILDMAIRGADNDSLRHYWQAAGLLPRDSVEYLSAEILEDGPVKAIQFHGRMLDRPHTEIHTRYEIRPCEPGVRIRTELINLERAPSSWALLDGFYFGGRENLGFAPFPGGGFNFRSFGLGELTEVMTPVPYVVAGMHAEPAATYATVACNKKELYTFLTEEVTPVGLAPTLVMPRDYLIFERFLAAADGAAVSAGADLALEIREQLFDETWTTVSGTVVRPDSNELAGLGEGLRALVTISEGDAQTPIQERIPWTLAIPDADGHFEARVPTDRDYIAEVEAYGQVVAEEGAAVGSKPGSFGSISLPPVASVLLSADSAVGDAVLVFVHPSDDATETASTGQMLGHFDTCAPLLGHPHAGSPACNRVLVPRGLSVPISLAPGTYDFLAVAGPFSTLAHVEGVQVAPGGPQSVYLHVDPIDGLQPPGTLSGDFHVHGRSSFDSSLDDVERARSFLAAGIDVIAATEHDVVFDYKQALQTLGATDELQILVGTEMTGAVLWYFHPTYTAPQVVGHWNIWPLTYDPTGPWRGAPWDEMGEPGELFTRAAEMGWPSQTGVAQLNHPIGGAQFGRDFGWISATRIQADKPLTNKANEAQGLWSRTPEGAAFANSDYNVQEVMNGTNNLSYLAYRDFWFYLLDQGELRGGTANSDTHTLTENVVGFPRTLVWADTQVGDRLFDEVVFDRAVREGRMIGTNGPILEVSTTDATGAERAPSLDVFQPQAGATVEIRLDAAPWVPLDEIRIWVNSELVQTIAVADRPRPITESLPLANLLPTDGSDAWLVVEAGAPLADNADLDCDGWPDTGDNNGDGKINWRDTALDADPEGCIDVGDAGPLTDPPKPERGTPEWIFQAVVPGGYPLAFTNPLVFDGDGDGVFTGPGR